MSRTCSDALEKVEEARRSLGLMKLVWDTQMPHLPGFTAKEEHDYHLRQFMEACYSAISYFEEDSKRARWAKNFKILHPDFYAKGTGYRSTDVHKHSLRPEEKDYEPPHGNKVNWDELQECHPVNGNQVNWMFKRDLYFPGDSEQTIFRRCSEHWREVNDFVRQACS